MYAMMNCNPTPKSYVSLENQPASQIAGDRKDCGPTHLDPAKCWYHLNVRCFSFTTVRWVEILRY